MPKNKSKVDKKGKSKYQRRDKDGAYHVYELTNIEAVEMGFCGLCKKFIGETIEIHYDPMPGICHDCRKNLIELLNHFDSVIISIPQEGNINN